MLRPVVVTATDKPLPLYNVWFSTLNYLSSASSLLTISACALSHRWIYCLSLPFHTHLHTHTHTYTHTHTHTHTLNAETGIQPQFPLFTTGQGPVPLPSFATIVHRLGCHLCQLQDHFWTPSLVGIA